MSEPKLCPYRKIATANLSYTYTGNVETVLDEFAPCLQDKCAMWRTEGGGEILGAHGTPTGQTATFVGYCGLAGRP